MNRKIWLGVIVVALLYVGVVILAGYPGPIAISINFARVALAVAVLILYVPALGAIFRQVPAPSRDYLLAGIILTWLSGFCFAVWNETGRIFDIETSIFISPIGGFFSFLLAAGGVFHLLAPDTSGKKSRWIAIAIGLAVAIAVVLVAPLFR